MKEQLAAQEKRGIMSGVVTVGPSKSATLIADADGKLVSGEANHTITVETGSSKFRRKLW